MAISKKREKEILAEEKFRLQARKQAIADENAKKEREREKMLRHWAKEKEKAEKSNADNETMLLLNYHQLAKIPATFTIDTACEIFGLTKPVEPDLYAVEDYNTYVKKRKSIINIILQTIKFSFLLLIIACLITFIFEMLSGLKTNEAINGYVGIACLPLLALFIFLQIKKLTPEKLQYDYARKKKEAIANNTNAYKKIETLYDSIINLDAELIGKIVSKHLDNLITIKGIQYKYTVDSAAKKIVVTYSFLGINAVPQTFMKINDYQIGIETVKKEARIVVKEYEQYMCKVPLVIASAFFYAAPTIQHVICNGYHADGVKFPSGPCVLSVDFDKSTWMACVDTQLPPDLATLKSILQRFPFVHNTAGVISFS